MRGVGVCIDIWVDVDGDRIVEGKGLAEVDGEINEGKGEVMDKGGWDIRATAGSMDEDNEDVSAEAVCKCIAGTSPGCASAYASDNDGDGGPAYTSCPGLVSFT